MSTSRRDLIRSAAIASVAVSAANSQALAQVIASSSPATEPATEPTTAPADPITVGDVAAADKLAARDGHDSRDRELMLPSLETYRKRYRRVRTGTIDPTIPPAVRFDPRLPGTPIPTGPSSCTLSNAAQPDFDGNVESLAFASVVELSRLIKARKITSTQLTRMYLDRLNVFGPKLNCVVTLTEAIGLKQAARADEELAAGNYRGPLHGIPYGAKDLLATKGTPTSWGVSIFKDQTFEYDATVIEKLERAGAVLLAKLSLGELAMGDVWFGGKTRNPWKPDDGSSGSSAGPGAATAAGLVGFSIGSETLGSIVSPCVTNGVVGLRPTFGRVSLFGAMPLTWTMDKLGPMCRGVEDCAIVLHAIHGADEKDLNATAVPFAWNPGADLKSLRVGIDTTAFDWNHTKQWKDESLKQIYREAIEQLRSIVGELRPVRLPDSEKYGGMAGTIIAAESASVFGDLVADGRIRQLVQQEEGSWPNTFRVGSTVPAADYLRVMRLRTMLMREMAEVLREIDLYITMPFSPSLAITNLSGHPSLIVRCGMHENRPRMIELIGALYREDAILRVGLAYEQATGWRRHVPSMDEIRQKPG